jgi:hypothetical protein
MVDQAGFPGENYRPAASHWQTLSHVFSTPHHERDSSSQLSLVGGIDLTCNTYRSKNMHISRIKLMRSPLQGH